MTTFQGPWPHESARTNQHTARDNEDILGLQAASGDRQDFWELPQAEQTLLTSSKLPHQTEKQRHRRSRCSFTISLPFALLQLCLLVPSALLLALITYFRVGSSKSIFANSQGENNKYRVYTNISATILTNISSVSSTLAPFLVGLIMEMWSPYVARALIDASQEYSETSGRLPTPFQFSLLANMRAGRGDQIWKYVSQHFQASRRQKSEIRPSILKQTALILFLSLLVTLLTFLGDQFFHIWSKSVVLERFKTPDNFNSFGRGLSHRCITFDRAKNYGNPCTSDSSLPVPETTARENDISYIRENTSELHQIDFLTTTALPRGDLAVLYPAASIVPSGIDYSGSTLGVSTQCQFMTPICNIKHLSDILTQFNCTESFFGVLGKPANISYDMFAKAQDPDVPGLAWKISPSLEYAFFSDSKLQVPYNVLGYNPITGNGDPDLPLMPDSKLVNPVYLSVAGRVTEHDMVIDSSLATESAHSLFQPTYSDQIFDFFLNCSYTTYDVKYTLLNGKTQLNFTFTPSPNGSVAEQWHGRQQYVSLNGDPSEGLVESHTIAAKETTPEAFARKWANFYSVRVLSVIGAYSNPRLNIQEQVRSQLLVTSIAPWTLAFLLAANFSYALLATVAATIAWATSTKTVIEMSKKMDLNRQITERYGGVEMSDVGKNHERTLNTQDIGQRDQDSALRVGVVGSQFESLYFAT